MSIHNPKPIYLFHLLLRQWEHQLTHILFLQPLLHHYFDLYVWIVFGTSFLKWPYLWHWKHFKTLFLFLDLFGFFFFSSFLSNFSFTDSPSPAPFSRLPCFSYNSLVLRADLASSSESVYLTYISASTKFLYDFGSELINNKALPSSSKASLMVASVSHTWLNSLLCLSNDEPSAILRVNILF